jgi:hypothetical protein
MINDEEARMEDEGCPQSPQLQFHKDAFAMAMAPLDLNEKTPLTHSVVYRTGPLTLEDYDEAIEALKDARAELEHFENGGAVPCCGVCQDTGHTADWS